MLDLLWQNAGKLNIFNDLSIQKIAFGEKLTWQLRILNNPLIKN